MTGTGSGPPVWNPITWALSVRREAMTAVSDAFAESTITDANSSAVAEAASVSVEVGTDWVGRAAARTTPERISQR